MAEFKDRLQHAWNAFINPSSANKVRPSGYQWGNNPSRVRVGMTTERSIINSIYTRIAVDCAAVNINHVRLQGGRYLETINSPLNYCLTTEANKDQTGRAFRQDIVATLIENGSAAIVPVDTSISPILRGGFDIKSMRVGKVVSWYPDHVRISLYDDRSGLRKEIVLPKSMVAIVENPLYNIMNEPNSTLRRLINKINLLDTRDAETASGKLDMIIQLPYVIKSEARKEQAERRRTDIEMQLTGSKYGIAYTDGTEKITQLNRPVENTLALQVQELTKNLYSQLGMTEAIFNGTANEEQQTQYYNRTIEPIVAAITDAMHRTFLTKTARSQQQAVWAMRDPFKLLPVSALANVADIFTRNEILSSNEIRALMGFPPVDDQAADELRNKNIEATPSSVPEEGYADEEYPTEEPEY